MKDQSRTPKRRARLTPKQRVLKAFPHACVALRSSSGRYTVRQSVISWGESVGADGNTPREAWAKAADNLKNWRENGLI